jgi:hypothetical protein
VCPSRVKPSIGCFPSCRLRPFCLKEEDTPAPWAEPHPKSDGVHRNRLKHAGLWLERVLCLVAVSIA